MRPGLWVLLLRPQLPKPSVDFLARQKHRSIIPPVFEHRDQSVLAACAASVKFVRDPQHTMHPNPCLRGHLAQELVSRQQHGGIVALRRHHAEAVVRGTTNRYGSLSMTGRSRTLCRSIRHEASLTMTDVTGQAAL